MLSYSHHVQGALPDTGEDVLRKDARSLFSLYFAHDAAQPIRVPSALHAQLVAYVQGDAQLTFEVVLRAQKHVYELMKARHFKRFLDSPMFAQYRKEANAALAESTRRIADPLNPLEATADDGATSGSAGSLARAAPQIRLGRIDDLGFYVSEIDGAAPDSFSLEIDMDAVKQQPSALSVVFGAQAVDPAEEERQARGIARHIVLEVTQTANPSEVSYLEEDGI